MPPLALTTHLHHFVVKLYCSIKIYIKEYSVNIVNVTRRHDMNYRLIHFNTYIYIYINIELYSIYRNKHGYATNAIVKSNAFKRKKI